MSSGPPLNLNYSASVPARFVKPGYLISRLISSYIGYMLVMGVLCLIVPIFESAFSDSGIKLPPTTVALLQASRVCLRGYLWLWCMPIPAMWAFINVNIPDKYRRRRLRLAAFLLVVGFLFFTLFALLPTMQLLPVSGAGNGTSAASK